MEKQLQEKRMVAATSVGAAIFLTGAKLLIGFMTGSLGILAEAAHSALDLVAAVITFLAVRVSDRPADDSHLYGHGKVENLSALIETLLLLITCLWIIYEGIHRLLWRTIEVDPSIWAFLVMGVSIVIDFSRSRALARVAKKYRSQALEADALHFRTDIWSSAVVIVGLGLVRYGEYRGGDKSLFEAADAIAALVVAGIVVYVSVRLGRRAVDALLDRAPIGMADQLKRSVGEIDGILGISRIRLRDVGSRFFVDLEVDVPRYLSFEESHQLTLKAQEAIRSIIPNADVMVHADPIQEKEDILEEIHSIAARERGSIHNVTTHWTEQGMWIDLDLEVDPQAGFAEAHELATNLETKLRAELIRSESLTRIADINVHIEPRNEASAPGVLLEARTSDPYIRRVQALGMELPGCCGSHKIELHDLSGTIYLSFHLMIHSSVSIKEAHQIAEEMESRLRLEFPEFGRIVIHTEPG